MKNTKKKINKIRLKNCWMVFTNYLQFVWLELLYSIAVIVYLVRLDRLNKVLTSSECINNAVKLLSYNSYMPIKYFAFAVGFALVGAVLIVRKFNRIRNSEESCGEIVVSLVAMAVMAMLIILLIVFINNPIFRAILTCVCIIVGGVSLIVQ